MSGARMWVRTAADHRFARSFAWAFVRYARVFPFLLLLVFLPLQWVRTDPDRDSVGYYLAAERVRTGDSMYEPLPPPGPNRPDAGYYVYPPFLAAAIALAPEVSWPTFARVWLLIVLTGYWVFAASLSHLAIGRVTLTGTLVAGAALGLVPGVVHALNMGQADILVWACAGLALAFPRARGAGFAVGAMLKVVPVWPLLIAIRREGRTALPGAALALCGGGALAAAALGFDGFASEASLWLRYIAPSLAQGEITRSIATVAIELPLGIGRIPLPALMPSNMSLSFAPILLARALGWWEYGGGPLPGAFRFYLTTFAIAAPLTAAWLFRRRPPVPQCAAVLIAALVFAPVFRLTYLPVVIAAVIAIAGPRARRERASAPVPAAITVERTEEAPALG